MRTYSRTQPNHEVIENVHELCRLCLCKAENVVPIFAGNKDNVCAVLALRIMICVGLEIKHEESLPNKICTECLNCLNKCYTFRKKCVMSYQRLKSHILAVNQGQYRIKLEEQSKAKSNESQNALESEQEMKLMVIFDDEFPETSLLNLNGVANKLDKRIGINTENILQNDDNQVSPTLIQDTNTFKIVDPVIHLSCAPVTWETSDVEHPNMDRSGIIDDNVQVKEEQVEDVQYDTDDFITGYTGHEDIVKTENDVSSYNTHSSEAGYNSPSKSAELSVGSDVKPEHIIQCMEPQDDLQLDHSMAFTEFNDYEYLKPVRIVLNRFDLDSIETGTLAAEKLKPDLLKNTTQSTAQTEARYRQFSNKVETIDETLVDKNIVCNSSQLDKQINEKPYKYYIFEKEFCKKSELRKHIRVRTGERPYNCDICKKGFIRKNDLSRHIRVHTGEKPYSCHMCFKHFNQKSHLSSHIRLHTGEKSYSCHVCNKHFNHKSNLSSRIPVQTCDKPYSCDISKKGFTGKSGLSEHIRVHTGEKSYSCHICNKHFNRKRTLNNHILVHTGEKPYSCHICNKHFNRKRTLNNHILVHTGEKPYSCHICHKHFNHKANLSRHIRGHTGEKRFRCDICKKGYTRKGDLTKHIRIHTGEKPYSCPICHKHFNQKGHLSSHISLHTGEKPYSCHVCNKHFNNKANISRHICVHTGKKPYRCDICKKGFIRKGDLTKHIRIHMGEKPYSCDICKNVSNVRTT